MFYDLGLYYPGGRDDFKSMITDHYYVIHYKTNDCSNARIPVHKMDDFTNTHGGSSRYVELTDEGYPFTGTGSTPDAPELYTPTQKVSEGAIFKVNADGSCELPIFVRPPKNVTVP